MADKNWRVKQLPERMEKTTGEAPVTPSQRNVWSHNLREELALLKEYLPKFPIVAIDTEFPGFLRYTPKGVSEEEFYDCLRFNVNRLNILQLGLTLTDNKGNIGMTWEFNFRDFDLISDMEGVSSLDSFLKNKGFDFEKLRKDGIAPEEFSALFFPICRSGRISRWITFHGLYDIAYLMKLLKIRFMATSMAMFATTAQQLLGTIVDLKHLARYCSGLLNGELGLNKLAKLLDVKRIGNAHFAGSDSLLTASVYAKMKMMFKLPPEQCEGFLYGLPHPIRSLRPVVKVVYPSAVTLPPLPKCSLSSFSRSSSVFVGDCRRFSYY